MQSGRDEKRCNCRGRATVCPLDGECQIRTVIYQATVTAEGVTKTYTGLTDNTFKERYSSHKYSFTHASERDSTTLSQYVWQLKDVNQLPSVGIKEQPPLQYVLNRTEWSNLGCKLT